jgi:hypothetical protein
VKRIEWMTLGVALALPVAAMAQGVQVRTTRQGQIPENPAKIIEIVGAPEPARTVAVQPQDDLERILGRWDSKPATVARQMIQKYGQPDEVSTGRVIWHNKGPWKRTEVANELVRHDLPTQHDDVLTQVIRYQVPAEITDELAKFHPGIVIDRAKGELSVRCIREDANLLAVNLADEIVRRARTPDDARSFFAQAFFSDERQHIAYKQALRLPIASAQ